MASSRATTCRTIVAFLEDARDQAANAVGFNIADLTVTGQNQLTKEEVLAAARVTGRSSLLFLDADATRERLKANSWIADATVRKLLPGPAADRDQGARAVRALAEGSAASRSSPTTAPCSKASWRRSC